MNQVDTDITIIGGGLAGMTLALQVHKENPNLDIVVVERNTFPVNNTTAKVGESTVEIGSHYLSEVLGLQSHFKEHHLKKHGLRCFFGAVEGDYSKSDELGVSQLFGIPTYQIERGVLENHLFKLLNDRGIRFLNGASVSNIEIGSKDHALSCSVGETQYLCKSPWLIDAAGRQALLKNKLNLQQETGHKGNAVFFRVSDTIIIDEWSTEQEWQDRVKTLGKRWLSTNHLMGPGYWVWIIPLGSGATSFGIVMDDQAFAESKIESFKDTMAWLRKVQPRCASALENTQALDFKVIKDYSYGCKQMYSKDGWALSGEAGAFPDPFYSPGSDFIAMGNTFITQLILKDFKGESIEVDSFLYQKFYSSFFENTLSLYKHQYGGFGDRKMMSVKLVWDYTYYWGVLTLLFFTNSITCIETMRKLNPKLRKAQVLNKQMQMAMNQRAQRRLCLPSKGLFMDQFLVPCLRQLNEVLKNPKIDVEKALDENIELMEKLLPFLEDMLQDQAGTEVSESEKTLLGDYRLSVVA